MARFRAIGNIVEGPDQTIWSVCQNVYHVGETRARRVATALNLLDDLDRLRGGESEVSLRHVIDKLDDVKSLLGFMLEGLNREEADGKS